MERDLSYGLTGKDKVVHVKGGRTVKTNLHVCDRTLSSESNVQTVKRIIQQGEKVTKESKSNRILIFYTLCIFFHTCEMNT